jgi:nitroreductase
MTLKTITTAPWNLREADFPIGAPPSVRARYLLRYAILAPSANNLQPWKFRIAGETIHVLADTTRWSEIGEAGRRELFISLGCAIENLIVAADHFGYTCRVDYEPPRDADTPDIVASVTIRPALAGAPRQRSAGLFAGLTSRHMLRGSFTARPVLPAFRRQLSQVQPAAGVRLVWIEDAATMGGPLLGVIATERDERVVQVKTGQLFERVCLMASLLGLTVHPVSLTRENAGLWMQIAGAFGHTHAIAQQVFQIGYARRRPRHTPRRPVEEVVL